MIIMSLQILQVQAPADGRASTGDPGLIPRRAGVEHLGALCGSVGDQGLHFRSVQFSHSTVSDSL